MKNKKKNYIIWNKTGRSITAWILAVAILFTNIPMDGIRVAEAATKEYSETEKISVPSEKPESAKALAEESSISEEEKTTPDPTGEEMETQVPIPTEEVNPTAEPEITPVPSPTATATAAPVPSPTAEPTPTVEAASTEETIPTPSAILEELYITGYTILQEDTVCSNLHIITGDLYLNGHTLIVQGNVTAAGSINTTDGKLTVEGDYRQTNGLLNVSRGTVEIKGNCEFAEQGYLYMNDTATRTGELLIRGGLIISSQSPNFNLTYGGITIGGNLLQTEEAAEKSLHQSGSFHTSFNGSSRQDIYLAHAKTSRLGQVDMGEAEDVHLETAFYICSIKGLNGVGNAKEEKIQMDISNGSLFQDETLKCGLELLGGVIYTGENKLSIAGDVTAAGSITTTDGKLIVEGNYTQTKEFLNNSRGTAEVKGNCEFTEQGYLYMYDIATRTGELLIGGDLTISSQSRDFNQTYGSITIGGDLLQTEEAAESSLDQSGSFRTSFNGSSRQDIYLAHAETSRLGQADMRKAADVRLKTALYICSIKGLNRIGNAKEEQIQLNISNGNLFQNETLKSGLELLGGAIVTGEYQLNIAGDVTAAGSISTTDGNLTVEGNYNREMVC